jgi:hypothetical protein
MPIVGVTHEKDGRVRLSRTVTTKVAIGLPPSEGQNYPTRLDHFIFLRKQLANKTIEWVPDQKLIEHYGQNCREIWVVFLDDDPDQVFRTEYAGYVKRGCWCRGDGIKAQRRDLGRDGSSWGPFQEHKGPCAEGGCPNVNGDVPKLPCNPSGDLYFMLADFPSLGSICRWHTGSYQSIRQVYTALQDLRRVTGGRLMGVTAKLFMYPDKSAYEQGGVHKTGTKWVLGLELRAEDMAGIQTKLLETARVFSAIKGELGGQRLEIVDEDEERGAELTPEFYPAAAIIPAEAVTDDKKVRDECDKLMESHGLNRATRELKLEEYRGRLPELLEKIKPKTIDGNGNGHSRGAAIGAGPGAASPTSPTHATPPRTTSPAPEVRKTTPATTTEAAPKGSGPKAPPKTTTTSEGWNF